MAKSYDLDKPGKQCPPVPHEKSGDGMEVVPSNEAPGAEQAEGPTPPAWSASTPVDPDALATLGVELREQAVDAYFADVSWLVDSPELDVLAPKLAAEDFGPALKSAIAAAAVLVGGSGGAWRAEMASDTRRRLRM
jgi:hypothetical protein